MPTGSVPNIAPANNALPANCLEKNKGRSTREGIKLAVPVLIVGMALLVALPFQATAMFKILAGSASIVCVLSAAWVLRFFRDFQPVPPADNNAVVSPAHGVVDCIDYNCTSSFLPGPCTRVSIYLSLENIHVQYAPVHGQVVHCEHIPGKRQRAIHQKAAMENEHLVVVIETAERPPVRIALKLIAGVWVRRIVPWFVLNTVVGRSERLGLIRFGSRVDVCLPAVFPLKVRVGDRVIGGETALATILSPDGTTDLRATSVERIDESFAVSLHCSDKDRLPGINL